tara:strand:- start:2511 stop:2945 length:435 start_codon:yes stop_codon:yes gene_type:complete
MIPLISDVVRHAHLGFAYFLFFLVVSQFILALFGAGRKPEFARIFAVFQLLMVRVLGPLIILAGCGLWWSLREVLPPNTWWIWATFLLWGPVEVSSKRMVAPSVAKVIDGGDARGTLIKASLLQLICVAGAFGLMQANNLSWAL